MKCQQVCCVCKDELLTTTRSYDGQLSMMSEHLAAMNERLTQQKDEIDILKYQLEQQQQQQHGSKVVRRLHSFFNNNKWSK